MKDLDAIAVRIHEWMTAHFPLARQRRIDFDESLLDTGIVDSLGTLDIVLFLEQEFGVEVSDEEMVEDHFESILSIAGLVESKMRPAAAQAEGA